MYRKIHSYYSVSRNINIFYKYEIDYGTCMHTHESWIFGLVLQGERILQIGENIVRITSKQYYLIPPNYPHKLLQGKDLTESIVISIKFNKDLVMSSSISKKYSREYWIRKTRATYGISPGRLERQNKIRDAIELLFKGYTEAYIASELGFYDQAHFCHCFKSIWGITPQELFKSKKLLDKCSHRSI
jgi:hypothetical protein